MSGEDRRDAQVASALIDYLDSIKARDPAARSRWEILLYPGVWAIGFHRLAHWLYGGRLYFLARLINHISRGLTAIDIHPGASIGRNFFIDHGFTVIGETAQIGDNVTIYQNVTLGGTNPSNGIHGKRHPTLHDGVVIGSGAQVLGPLNVGAGARVGANAVVTKDVAPETTVVGIPARPVDAEVVHYSPGFVAYGTPCGEDCDPQPARVLLLEQQVMAMQQELAALRADRAASAAPVGPLAKVKSV